MQRVQEEEEASEEEEDDDDDDVRPCQPLPAPSRPIDIGPTMSLAQDDDGGETGGGEAGGDDGVSKLRSSGSAHD